MITIEQIKNEVDKIAKERPEVRYIATGDTCYYGHGECSDGSKGCIFGQAFKRLNIQIDEDYLESKRIDRALYALGIDSGSWTRWCLLVQSQQDLGRSWSKCILYANNFA